MESLQWPQGLKRTKPREQVYDVLAAADRPLDVREIYSRLEGQGLALSTVYRVLTAFEEHQMVTKTTIMGEDTALYALRRHDHAHYAICMGCHKQVQLPRCPLQPVELEMDGFSITNHRLELYGYCRDCKKRHSQDD